jgi:hypothetical protein
LHPVADGDEAASRDEISVDVGAHVHPAAKGIEIRRDAAALDDGLAHLGSLHGGRGRDGRAEREEAEGDDAGGSAPGGHRACMVCPAP